MDALGSELLLYSKVAVSSGTLDTILCMYVKPRAWNWPTGFCVKCGAS
jgi:hypothetical protein